jgi:multiple sugar transport system ATP-binding protein
MLKGKVGVAEHLGSDTFIHVAVVGSDLITVRTEGEIDLKHGDTVYLSADEDRIYRFAEDGRAIQ